MSQVADAVLFAIDQAGLAPAGPVLVMMARDIKLSSRFPDAHVWNPAASDSSSWAHRGHPVLSDLNGDARFGTVIVFCPKQKEETLYLIARAQRLVKADGLLIAAAENLSGGQALPKAMTQLGIEAASQSKHKCRVVWTQSPQGADIAACTRAIAAGATQTRDDGLLTQPGLFSWNRLDKGTDALLHHLPFSLAGTGADFGCGIGVIGQRLLQRYSAIDKLYCIDNDNRAIECCQANLAAWRDRCDFMWADIRKLPKLPPLDFVVMNPPFHQGRADDTQLGQSFIQTAAASLKPGGVLALVANIHLPYEGLLQGTFSMHRVVSAAAGFKVIEAVK